MVAGEAEEAALARLFRAFERLDGSAWSEYLIHVLLVLDSVHLPEVHIVALQAFQRGVQVLLGLDARPFGGLGRDENLFADVRQNVAVDFFGMAIPVGMRAVKVIQAQVVGVPHLGACGLLVAEQGQPCPTTVSFTPVLPNSRIGVAPTWGFCGRAFKPVIPSPAKAAPMKILRPVDPMAL